MEIGLIADQSDESVPTIATTAAIQLLTPLISLVEALPWVIPGMAVTAVIACAAAGRVARRARTESWIAFVLIMSVGTVLAATLTPANGPIRDEYPPLGRCNFSRIGPVHLSAYLQFDKPGLNVILFLPLGLALGLLGRSPATARLLLAAAALSPTIESIQSLLPMFGRGCATGDVVDNVLGLGIGFTLGALLSVIRARRTRRH
ncbi:MULTISPECIES: VanZ family protein [unclassified Mycolicibacterium]|uniref:VanZ family protein n=1 Tax=unclassified Mycolicibacterium TaxID=2636767 RepID=UPI001391F79B|nr:MULTISPECIES: VanZ family protein [unclassified Mycolicibacterium]